MRHKNQSDKPTGAEFSASDVAPLEVSFGSNAVRLTTHHWAWVAVIVLAVLAGAPRSWSRARPLDSGPDFRMPYALSEDYWLYQRHVSQAMAEQQVVVVGDSVIWGEYVAADQTLSHDLSQQIPTTQFFNGGLNGTHPLALSGLVRNYASSLRNERVVVHCNLLWMSSPERDLQIAKQIQFNHPDLVPQFLPNIPCYKANLTARLGIIVDRNLSFRSWAKHFRIAAFDGQDLPRWTLEHPWTNPLQQIFMQPVDEEQPRPPPVPWVDRGIQPQDLPWIELDSSLQWHAFQRLIQYLNSRSGSVFVIVGPLNEHMLTAASAERYNKLVYQVDDWLRDHDVAHTIPAVLPSGEYADASHPLAAGYSRLAKALVADPQFQQWLDSAQ